MDWTSMYNMRVTTAQEAVKIIKSGDRIFLTGNVLCSQDASECPGRICALS